MSKGRSHSSHWKVKGREGCFSLTEIVFAHARTAAGAAGLRGGRGISRDARSGVGGGLPGSSASVKKRRIIRIRHRMLSPRHAALPPWPLSFGKTGGRKLAHLVCMCDLAAARPARTDLGRPFLEHRTCRHSPTVSACRRAIYGALLSRNLTWATATRARAQRNGDLETPDGPTGTPRSVDRFAGYAGLSPHSRRRDKRSRRRGWQGLWTNRRRRGEKRMAKLRIANRKNGLGENEGRFIHVSAALPPSSSTGKRSATRGSMPEKRRQYGVGADRIFCTIDDGHDAQAWILGSTPRYARFRPWMTKRRAPLLLRPWMTKRGSGSKPG
jgi:hypothetical protein